MATYGEVRVHNYSPSGMYGSGNIDVWREGSRIRATGTTKFRIASKSKYGYHYAAAIYWKGSEYTYWAIKDNNNSGSGQSYSKGFDVTIDDNSAGTLILRYLCCGAGNGDGSLNNRGTCNATPQTTPYCDVYSIDIGPGYARPTISIDSITSIGRHDTNSIQAHCTGNGSGDPTGTTVTWYVNGDSHSYGAYYYGNYNNIGNDGGYLSDSGHPHKFDNPNYFRPSEAGVGEGSQFSVKARRVHNGNTGLTAEDTKNAKTYRVPKIKDGSITLSEFSGTGGSVLKYSTNGARWDSSLEVFETYIEMSADNWAQEKASDQGPGRSDADNYSAKSFTLSRAYLERHISEATRNTSDSVSTKVRVERKNTKSGVYVRTGEFSIKVYYKPTLPVTGLIFKKNNSNGSVITPGSNIIVSSTSDYYTSNVYVGWTYPGTDSSGIIDGYLVRIYDKNGNLTKTYTVETTSYSSSKLIPVGDLNPAQLNKISITPYYKRPNGTKAEGPMLTSDFVMPYQELDKPAIIAPTNNSNWINKNYRVLMTLPSDPDYSYLSSRYTYADIELKVNDKTYSWSENKNIFSSSNLSYKRNMIINPSLMNDYPDVASYTLQVRVKKNYGTNNEMWSKWSNEYKVTITTDSFSVNRGDLIMASHYNTLQPLCRRMKGTYPLPTGSYECLTVKVGDIIYAADYNAPYNDIKSVETAVNEFGEFDSDRNPVKFPTIPVFVPVVGEFITAKSNDTAFPGRNYIRLMHDYANMLK